MDRKEWLQWRLGGIGASDASAVMGISEYATPYQLWELKTGKIIADDKENFAMRKGNEYEPYARAKYELINDQAMPTLMCVNKDFDFLRATMDGFNTESMTGIEIKYVGKDMHEKAKQGIVPDKYMAQIQHQIFVTGAKWIDYLSYYVPSGKNPDGSKIVPDAKNGELIIIKVFPDPVWIQKYLVQAGHFWNCVQTDTPPELTDRDFKTIKNDAVAMEYIEALNALKMAENRCEDAKSRVLEAVGDISSVKFEGTGLSAVKQHRKGNVDYKKIPELKGIDLEPYRGKSISFYKLSVSK